MQLRFALLICGLFLLSPFPLSAQAPEDKVDYTTQIKPILKSNCFACHGVLKQESTLRLDSGQFIMRGGEIGAAVVPGKAEESLLYQVIGENPDFAMPPEGQGRKLKPDEVALIRAWINQGATLPKKDPPETAPSEHWAFMTIQRPPTPKVTGSVRNPIDAFLNSRMQNAGIIPQPPTDKATLLRRVYLDLIGLPPKPAELNAFLKDTRPDAYERVIDHLLQQPQYGERWGRHWMDVWRYSDWYGRRGAMDMTNSYSLTWRWRDWIIRSLNEDKGYDRMIMEMLAADEIAPDDRENLVATGFIVRNFYRWNYHTWLKDNVEHTGKAFLGLTMNCCECHDHKYDPIGQEEYFAFRSFFEPIDIKHDRVPEEADPGLYPDYKLGVQLKPVRTGMVRIYDRHLDANTQFYTGGLEQNVVKDKAPIKAAAIQFLGGDKLDIKPIELPVTTWYPGLKPFVIKDETQKRKAAVQTARQQWENQKSSLHEQLQQLETQLTALLARDKAEQQRNTASSKSDKTAPTSYQALQLSANQGRRTLAYALSDWKSFGAEILVRFHLRILSDSLVNFQLSNDLSAGRTNVYVAFNVGKIITFAPGTTSKTEIGTYQMAAGEQNFEVEILLKPQADVAELTVIQTADSKKIVDQTPIALNGWNPVNQKNCGLFLDAQSGSIAEFDDIVFLQQGIQDLKRFDFEFPGYRQGEDVPGIEDWQVTPFSTGTATSKIVLNKPLTAEEQKRQQEISEVTRKRDLAALKQKSLQQTLLTAEAEQAEYEARVRAAQARYLAQSPEVESLEKEASRLEWEANQIQAQAGVTSAELAFREAQLLPETDQTRKQKIQTAQQKLAQAQNSLTAASKPRAADSTAYAPLSAMFPKQSTGRRAALAGWIANRDNPLTARVAVNHIWMRHFGQPLVKSVNNFGRSGDHPTHPDLMNWLAVELMDHGWSMKHLHRLILLSDAYRRSSKGVAAQHDNWNQDRDNQLLWKFPTNRMEAEVVRDSLFALADDLDLKMYGQELEQNEGLITNRRSIYYSHHGESKMEFLSLFDGPSATDCYQRKTTVMPQQALALTNSNLAVKQSRKIAAQLWKLLHEQSQTDPGSQDQQRTFIQQTFELILSRPASEKELTTALRFLKQQETLFVETNAAAKSASPKQPDSSAKNFEQPATNPAARARESLVQALLNHNDFITIR